MSLQDNCFDYVTTQVAFANIPEKEKVAIEAVASFKSKRKSNHSRPLHLKNSKSYELSKIKNIERGIVEESLIDDLKQAGFTNIQSTSISKAVQQKIYLICYRLAETNNDFMS